MEELQGSLWLSGPAFVVGLAALLGLIVGSFLNVVAHRVPRGESIVTPASRCPGCAAPIRAWQNVPVLSYLMLRGRCGSCGMHISARYPAVEAFTGLVFAAVALRFGSNLESLLWMAFAAALIAAALIDFDHQIIPDEISIGGLVVGCVAVPAVHVVGGQSLGDALLFSVGGALLGGGMLWSVGFFHARISVALGRRFEHWPGDGEPPPRPSSLDYWTWFPGMGFGDVKLLAMIGAFLGPWGVLHTIIGASLAGLAMGLVLVAAKKGLASPFGFGPAIAAGAILALLVPQHFFFFFG